MRMNADAEESFIMLNTTIEMLSDLINICEDAREFYAAVAHRTNSRSLEETFRRIASTRESVIINLRLHALSIVGEAAEEIIGNGQTSDLFRPLKTEIDDMELTLVKKLEKAESAALEQFREALNSEPPEATTNLIERQMQMLDETHSHIKFLKRHLGNAAKTDPSQQYKMRL